jgi:hypothetical protein
MTQGSTIPQQAVSVLLKGVPLFLRRCTNVSVLVRNHEMCRFLGHVSATRICKMCRGVRFPTPPFARHVAARCSQHVHHM